MTEGTDLGAFLQARRGRVQPDEVGIQVYGRRRVSGLRREELASLAGVSVDYYVRLEQGRALNPSEEVLDAIAEVLALDETERVHLHRLGRPGRRHRRGGQAVELVRPGIARLLEGLDSVPAYVVGRRLDVIGWTSVGSALLGDFASLPRARRNLARLVFFDPAIRALVPDWDDVACETVGLLRLAAGRNPSDPGLQALIEELLEAHEGFRRLWAGHDVAEMTSGTRRFRHPVVGDLTLSFEALAVPDDASQMVVIYSAKPGSADDSALRLLAAWAERTPAALATGDS
jgi:transcriptional regulator with XRE-family HTH domain